VSSAKIVLRPTSPPRTTSLTRTIATTTRRRGLDPVFGHQAPVALRKTFDKSITQAPSNWINPYAMTTTASAAIGGAPIARLLPGCESGLRRHEDRRQLECIQPAYDPGRGVRKDHENKFIGAKRYHWHGQLRRSLRDRLQIHGAKLSVSTNRCRSFPSTRATSRKAGTCPSPRMPSPAPRQRNHLRQGARTADQRNDQLDAHQPVLSTGQRSTWSTTTSRQPTR